MTDKTQEPDVEAAQLHDAASPIVRDRNAGTQVVSGGSLYRIIATGTETDGRFSAMESVLEPGQGARFHVHTREDEAFYVLEGEVTFYQPGFEFVAGKDVFVSFPPHSPRAFRNNSERDVRMLLFYSSAGIEKMTLLDGQVVHAGAKASDATDARANQCPQLAEEYGVHELEVEFPN